ncbi:L-lactate permease [Tepidibacter aestuarii]|uniref:L-lactate permease n=1 Tax=Tepidibacter aestuarii TaxID=2925782 RepID=UPI0020C05178|nr:L-lactate permease [Tepidibacter aestuarii]CAH2213642.1 L-lactate permease [Tepidibacter aestuarii]CAH2215648.1 L-lactate permease [Tepidibacter aestuarii]
MNIYLLFLIALVPVAWLMISLGVLKIPAHKACPLGLLVTIFLSILVWNMDFGSAILVSIEGVVLGLWPIMIVIIAAIFTYNLALYTKSMDIMKLMLSSISRDKRIQVLILAWGFGGFLEAVAGYGTAVAIPASILISLGFDPIFAAVICLIANTVPTAFGAVGIPVSTLANVTGLDVNLLSYYVGLQLTIFIIIIPIVLVVITTKSIKGLKGVFGISLASGISFAIPQLLCAKYLGAELPALLGSICSLGMIILWAKVFLKKEDDFESEYSVGETGSSITVNRITIKEGILAWIPYILVFTFIIFTSPLFPNINEYLSHFKTSIVIYEGKTVFKWISTPGTLIILAGFIGGLIQGAKIKEIIKVFLSTLKQLYKSTITVVSIVALAKVMGYSGMITSLAIVLVKTTGKFFPLISPIIGALGTFITGSDTSSNVLFGALQNEVAKSIDVNAYWLTAANTSGATAGKMISPQSIAIATSATGMIGSEGKIFNKTLKFCAAYVVILGILVYIVSLFI